GAEGLESALAYINEDYYRTRLSDEEHDKLGQFLKGRDGELTAQTIARYQNEYNALVTPQYDEAGRITNTPLRPQEAVAELMKNGGGRASDETALRQELTKLQGQTALETAYRNYTENWDNGKALEKYLQRYSKGGDLFHQFDGADEKLLLTAQNLFKQALAAPGGGGGSASKLEKLTNEAVDSARMFVINQIQKGRFDQSILAAGKETIIGDVYTILKDTGFDVGDVEVFATKYYDRLTTDFFKIAREQLQENRPRAYNALIGIEDFLKDSFDEKKGIDGLNNLDSADQAALKREITDLVWDITVGTNWKAITDEDYEARINNVKALVAGKNLTALREFKQDTMNSDKYIAQRMFEIENIGKDIVSTGPQGEINVLSPYRGTIEWFKNFDKKRIADYLKEEEGLTISGESLRDEFDLSRSPADGYSVDDAGNEISFDRDATRTYTLGTPDGLRKFTQKTNDTGYGLYELFEDGSEKLLRGTLTQYEGSNAQKLDALLSEERNHKDELSLIIDRAVAAKNPPPDISEDRWRYMKSGEREEYVEKFEKTNPSGFKEWIERSYQEPPRGWAGKKPWNKMSLAEKIEAVGIFNKRGERTH
ncbi:MAG: hypothetical protein LBJ31_05730, partial [Treponema sp.]|nr:hypothetical protein [Treponema sp.]